MITLFSFITVCVLLVLLVYIRSGRSSDILIAEAKARAEFRDSERVTEAVAPVVQTASVEQTASGETDPIVDNVVPEIIGIQATEIEHEYIPEFHRDITHSTFSSLNTEPMNLK